MNQTIKISIDLTDEGLFGYPESIVTWETIEETTLMIFDVAKIKDIILKNDELKNIYIIWFKEFDKRHA